MPNWKTYEASTRLLSAIIAAHPGLKLNYDAIAGNYARGAGGVAARGDGGDASAPSSAAKPKRARPTKKTAKKGSENDDDKGSDGTMTPIKKEKSTLNKVQSGRVTKKGTVKGAAKHESEDEGSEVMDNGNGYHQSLDGDEETDGNDFYYDADGHSGVA